MRCFFVSDLHGRTTRYEKLWATMAAERPEVLFLGGDLLPHRADPAWSERWAEVGFIRGYLADGFSRLSLEMGSAYPTVLVIMGNDDPRSEEPAMLELERLGLWTYVHDRQVALGDVPVFGYACVPPTPFMLKDWERYDVSRHVEPGDISPEEGFRTVPADEAEVRYGTIQRDLERLTEGLDLSRAVMLFHSPPYDTALDRADLDGRSVDHAPLDVHVGSVAIRRFIEARQPAVTLHGHIHESARITGHWRECIGATHVFGGAHDGRELALIRFDTDRPEAAERELL